MPPYKYIDKLHTSDFIPRTLYLISWYLHYQWSCSKLKKKIALNALTWNDRFANHQKWHKQAALKKTPLEIGQLPSTFHQAQKEHRNL